MVQGHTSLASLGHSTESVKGSPCDSSLLHSLPFSLSTSSVPPKLLLAVQLHAGVAPRVLELVDDLVDPLLQVPPAFVERLALHLEQGLPGEGLVDVLKGTPNLAPEVDELVVPPGNQGTLAVVGVDLDVVEGGLLLLLVAGDAHCLHLEELLRGCTRLALHLDLLDHLGLHVPAELQRVVLDVLLPLFLLLPLGGLHSACLGLKLLLLLLQTLCLLLPPTALLLLLPPPLLCLPFLLSLLLGQQPLLLLLLFAEQPLPLLPPLPTLLLLALLFLGSQLCCLSLLLFPAALLLLLLSKTSGLLLLPLPLLPLPLLLCCPLRLLLCLTLLLLLLLPLQLSRPLLRLLFLLRQLCVFHGLLLLPLLQLRAELLPDQLRLAFTCHVVVDLGHVLNGHELHEGHVIFGVPTFEGFQQLLHGWPEILKPDSRHPQREGRVDVLPMKYRDC
eukprot:Sspe_Gene.21500::Locus_8083_Transcript_1_1_Confidence_1.000_Length_1678::g.21500::m.21500